MSVKLWIHVLTLLDFILYSAVADARGIHSGKDIPAPKHPLNISEVLQPDIWLRLYLLLTILIHKTSTRATQFLNGFKRLGRIAAVVDYVAAGSRFKCVNFLMPLMTSVHLCRRIFLPKDNQTLTLVLGGTSHLMNSLASTNFPSRHSSPSHCAQCSREKRTIWKPSLWICFATIYAARCWVWGRHNW